jgi:hypothetical protein
MERDEIYDRAVDFLAEFAPNMLEGDVMVEGITWFALQVARETQRRERAKANLVIESHTEIAANQTTERMMQLIREPSES